MNQIQKQREAHHKALEKLTRKPDGLKIWRKLRRLEVEAHKLAEDYCNGVKSDVRVSARLNVIAKKVRDLIGQPIYLSCDPRGYALKLEGQPDFGLHRDFGGYQILAPCI